MATEGSSSFGSTDTRTARSPAGRLPRATIRTRLTLIYGGLFLVSGAAVVVVTDVFWRNTTGSGPMSPASAAEHASDLHTLLTSSLIVLAVVAVLSLLLGWLVAGRMLRPLRTITATARAITASTLHERLSLTGPKDELRALGDTFDDLLGRLEGSFEAQRSFVANAAHELRTPHATMRVWLDVALAKPIPVPGHITDLGQRLSDELDHVDRLLDGLLVLARADWGATEDETAESLDRLIAAAITELMGTASGLELHVEQVRCPKAWVFGSETLLSRMVTNLIDNSVLHNVRGGFVRVSTYVEDATVRLVVENSGTPLDKAGVQQLGQPFRRLGGERTSASSTGLGLSIVAAVAAMHDGNLTLEARRDGGLRVVVELPLAQPDLIGAST